MLADRYLRREKSSPTRLPRSSGGAVAAWLPGAVPDYQYRPTTVPHIVHQPCSRRVYKDYRIASAPPQTPELASASALNEYRTFQKIIPKTSATFSYGNLKFLYDYVPLSKTCFLCIFVGREFRTQSASVRDYGYIMYEYAWTSHGRVEVRDYGTSTTVPYSYICFFYVRVRYSYQQGGTEEGKHEALRPSIPISFCVRTGRTNRGPEEEWRSGVVANGPLVLITEKNEQKMVHSYSTRNYCRARGSVQYVL